MSQLLATNLKGMPVEEPQWLNRQVLLLGEVNPLSEFNTLRQISSLTYANKFRNHGDELRWFDWFSNIPVKTSS